VVELYGNMVYYYIKVNKGNGKAMSNETASQHYIRIFKIINAI
jgi:hypothetical protein